jgi:hypothetical protein
VTGFAGTASWCPANLDPLIFAEADAWIEMSGAKSYKPFLHVARSELARLIGDEATQERELREAHRLFLEIGAPIRAAEIAKELGLPATT